MGFGPAIACASELPADYRLLDYPSARAHTVRVLSQEKLLALIGRIYDAAADERLWPAFLEEFATVADGNVGIVYYDWLERRARTAIFARFDPEQVRGYVEHYCKLNPWLKAFQVQVNCDGPASIRTGEQMLDPRELKRTEFYNDFLLPNDLGHEVAGVIVKGSEWGAAFTCDRSHRKSPFGTDEVVALRAVFPHLRRAMQLHRRFAELQGQQRMSLDALDRLSVGVVFLDQQGRILAINREAQRVLDRNDGLASTKSGLRAALSSENRDLRAAIAAPAGGTMLISRPSGKRPLLLLVSPVGKHAFPPEIRRPSIIVFITDPERTPGTLPAARAYGFTAAEARIAGLLAQGETLVRAASRLGITHNTARTHLQRIYRKTGAAHQGELVRLLLSGPLCP